jgi:hypothetical protein
MNDDRKWDDQPDEVLDAPLLANINIGDGYTAQIRNRPRERRSDDSSRSELTYLSVGNLFGSQTLKVPSLRDAIEVLGKADPAGETAKVPIGWVIK